MFIKAFKLFYCIVIIRMTNYLFTISENKRIISSFITGNLYFNNCFRIILFISKILIFKKKLQEKNALEKKQFMKLNIAVMFLVGLFFHLLPDLYVKVCK